MIYPKLIEDPDPQDSDDLSEADAVAAVRTTSRSQWVGILTQEVQATGLPVTGHDLRRRGSDLFIRTRLGLKGGENVLVTARTNWLGHSEHHQERPLKE